LSWPGPRRIEPFTETKRFRIHGALWTAYSPRDRPKEWRI
jgi:hypothetical protein